MIDASSPLTEQEEQRPKYEMTLACLLSQVALVDAPETVDDDQGPFVSERDAVRLANAAHRWFSANNPTLDALRAELAAARETNARLNREAQAAYSRGGKDAIEHWCRKRNNGRQVLQAELDALRARLAEVEGERDRYRLDYLLQRNRADRMTREAMAAADCIESEGWSDHEAKVSTYRAIRAENVKAEGEKA